MIRGIHVNDSTPGVYIDVLNLLNLGVNMVRGVQVNSSTPVPYNPIGENMIGRVTCSTPGGSYTNVLFNSIGENMIGRVNCSTPGGSYANKTCT